ncbi:MAG: GatB/YqeY domain-containing protein [Candidatus Saccharimonadales bacterium]
MDQDIKKALLAGDKRLAETIKTFKATLKYESSQKGQTGDLSDSQFQQILRREAKKRAETAEIYQKAGEVARAEQEMTEKAVIEQYLPQVMTEDQLKSLIDTELQKIGHHSPTDMGKIIGAVMAKAQGRADGAAVSRLVKEALES